MRFKITTRIDKTTFGDKLPLNYPYLLSSWIYHVIAKADKAYAAWLHDNAFRDGSKTFKFFTFSNLFVPKFRIEKDRLVVLSDTMSFYLSFLPEKSTEKFIKGIFQSQCFTLGDKRSKVLLEVIKIELMPTPDFSSRIEFKSISPIVVSLKESDGTVSYLSPAREGYASSLLKNLKEKYKIYYNKEYSGSDEFWFEVLSEPKSRLLTIKADSPEETRIRGYNFLFRLQANEELLKIAYESGLGEKGSIGFGMIGVVFNKQ